MLLQERNLTQPEIKKLKGLKLDADVALQILNDFVNYFREELGIDTKWALQATLDKFSYQGNDLLLTDAQIEFVKMLFIDSQIAGSKVDLFIMYLRRKYNLDDTWKIDLDKGVFLKEADIIIQESDAKEEIPKEEKTNASKKRKSKSNS